MKSAHFLMAFVLFLAAAGCVTSGPKSMPEPAINPVRTAMERETRAILTRCVKCDAWWPDSVGWGGSGRECFGPVSFFERNYIYEFRCVKDESEERRAGVGWLLPADEYPRIIDASHREFSGLIVREGGKITHTRKTGSTFELDYTINEVEGRLRGRIGPSDLPLNAGPDYQQQYTLLAVDFREENAKR